MELPRKATGFMSNVELSLKKMPKGSRSKVSLAWHKNDGRKQIRNYNKRSDIPTELVRDILNQILDKEKASEQFTV